MGKQQNALDSGIRKAKKHGFSSTSDCGLIGNLKLPIGFNEKVRTLSSVKNQLIIHTNFGRLYAMESTSIEDILLNPYIEEIKPSFVQFFEQSSNEV